MGYSAGGGFDEISILGPSSVAAFTSGQVHRFEIDPPALGFTDQYLISSLIGGNAAENAARIRKILSNHEHGAARDMIVLNAAAAIHITGKTRTLSEAIELAKYSLDSGRALRALDLLIEASSEAAR
jgi:anthranilate phosphoribosyltransferase